jgi:hypothetical protein
MLKKNHLADSSAMSKPLASSQSRGFKRRDQKCFEILPSALAATPALPNTAVNAGLSFSVNRLHSKDAGSKTNRHTLAPPMLPCKPELQGAQQSGLEG